MKKLQLIFLLAIITLSSCSTDKTLQQEEADFKHNNVPNTRADFTGRIKRVKIKKRRVGSGYKITAIGEGDTQDAISTVSISGGPLAIGPIQNNWSMELQRDSENDSTSVFRANNLEFEGGNFEGQLTEMEIKMLDSEGGQLGGVTIDWTPIGNFTPIDGIQLKKPQVTRNFDNSTKVRAVVKGENRNVVEQLYFKMSNGQVTTPLETMILVEEDDTKMVFEWIGEGAINELEPNTTNRLILIAHNGEGNMADYQRRNVTINEDNGIKIKNVKATYNPLDGGIRATGRIVGTQISGIAQTMVQFTFGDDTSESVEMSLLNNGEVSSITSENPVFIGGAGANMNILAKVTANDENGNVLEETEFELTLEEDYGFNVTSICLKRNDDGETFSLRAVVKGYNKDWVASLSTLLESIGEGSLPINPEAILPLVNENENRNIYRLNNIQFENPDNVVDRNYSVSVSALDYNNDRTPGVLTVNVCHL